MTILVAALVVLAAAPWVLGVRRGVRPTRGGARRVGRRRSVLGEIDTAVLLDLADAALAAGASVPGTLQALGHALEGTVASPAPGRQGSGGALRQAGTALLLGAPWDEAWAGAPAVLAPLADALEPAWADGVAPGPLVRRAADTVRAGRHGQAQEAAARLGVWLVLPLGICFLPAFVLLGIIPVVLAVGGGLF
ncbi:MAG: type II secretion system F family protein [Georgenia sp.]